MTYAIGLILALALVSLVTRRRRHRVRRAAKWLWAHPATVGLFVVSGWAWHRVGFNWALVVAVGYTTLVVIGRFWWQRTHDGNTVRQSVAAYRKQPIPRQLRIQVFKRDGFQCVYCGDTRNLSVDHIVPESRGGPMTLENAQTLCRSCNSTKGAHGPVALRSAQQGAYPVPPRPLDEYGVVDED